MKMPFRSVTLHLGEGADVDYVSNVLIELGALSVSVTDRFRGTSKEEVIMQEPPVSIATEKDYRGRFKMKKQYWRNSVVVALFPLGPSGEVERLVMRLAADYDLPLTPALAIVDSSLVEEDRRDWVSHTQNSCAPVHIGRVCIRFPWNEKLELQGHDENDMCVVEIEPCMAFGTGEHPTTQLIVRWLQSSVRGGESVLDYGSGSGILAIVAVALGAHIAVGTDVDPEAIAASKANAVRNFGEGTHRQLVFGNPDFESHLPMAAQGYDIVVANILAQPLKELAELLVSRMARGGRIALSGILAEQAKDVADKYRQLGVVMNAAKAQGDWTLVAGYLPL